MSSSEVMRLTKECLLALRLQGRAETSPTPQRRRQRLDAPDGDAPVVKILDDDEEDDKKDGANNAEETNERTRRILATLKALLDFLPLRGSPKEAYVTRGEKIVKNEPDWSEDLLKQRREFAKTGFLPVLEALVESFDLPWFESLNKNQRKRFVDPFFLEGVPSVVFLLFADRVKSLPRGGLKLARLASMLEKFFTSDNFRNIFFHHAMCHHPGIEPDVFSCYTDKLLNALTSFPQIVANSFREQTPKYLTPFSYYTFVVLQLTLAISEIMLEKECSGLPLPASVPVWIGAVLGKLCFASGGYGDQVLVQLLSSNGPTCLDHRDWKNLFNHIFLNVPDTCLEATLLPLLRHVAHPIGVACILGEEFLLRKAKAVFLLTNKFLFVRHFNNNNNSDLILQNVMGYLSTATAKNAAKRDKVFIETLSRLLDVWCSESYLKRVSVDQHTYITKAILCAFARFTQDDVNKNGEALLSKLMSGMSSHLGSPTLIIRELGMILAEVAVDVLRTAAQVSRSESFANKLEFQHASSPEVERLMAEAHRLKQPPPLPTMKIGEKVVPTSIFPKWDSNSSSCITNVPTKIADLTSEELAEAVKKLEISESLQPPTAPNKSPANNKSGANVGISPLGNGVTIKAAAPEEELDSDDDLEPFDLSHDVPSEARAKAPKYLQECMEGMLSGQDSKDPNSDRLEICLQNCESLVRGAQADTMDEVGVEMTRILLHLADRLGVHNYDFEELRLNALIACVVKAPRKVANRFGPVAGCFFFPLLTMLDRPRATLDLLDKDHLLLGRLLYTLGVVLYSAMNTPACRGMAASLLEVVWCIRYHSQTYVRLSLFYAISIILISLPPSVLVDAFQAELLDTKAWLEEVVSGDPEPECQRQANQTHQLLVAAITQGWQHQSRA